MTQPDNDSMKLLELIELEAVDLRHERVDARTVIPSSRQLGELMELIWSTVFYESFHHDDNDEDFIRQRLLTIYNKLTMQVGKIISTKTDCRLQDARSAAMMFISRIHHIKHMVLTDVEAVMKKDPAATSAHEIIASYPCIRALLYYRAAHELLEIGVPVIPRMMSELAHSATGIDIHPGATIGEYCAIDHGTGVVIGETCIIGKHVTLYQGVTLGARGFVYDEEGNAQRLPRHPILEDNVTVYSNSSILGRITVGHDTVIGGNVWLTESVPPHSKITQSSIRYV